MMKDWSDTEMMCAHCKGGVIAISHSFDNFIRTGGRVKYLTMTHQIIKDKDLTPSIRINCFDLTCYVDYYSYKKPHYGGAI